MSFPNISTPVTQVDASALFDLGQLNYHANGNVYKYVKFLDSVTYLAGHVVYPASATLNYVTNDYTGGTAIGTINAGATPPTGHVAGVVMGIPAAATPFGWMQVAGIALVLGDGSIAAGEDVTHKNADGTADTMAAGAESAAFGQALDADDTANDPLATSALFHCKLRGLI